MTIPIFPSHRKGRSDTIKNDFGEEIDISEYSTEYSEPIGSYGPEWKISALLFSLFKKVKELSKEIEILKNKRSGKSL